MSRHLFGPVRRAVESQRKRFDPIALSFGEQRRAIECRAPLVALCCSGRAGKTRGFCLKWLEVAVRKPGQLSAFIALTRASAERIAWRQLEELNQEHGLGLKFRKADLVVEHPNGSKLILLGANRDDLIDVLRGSPFALVGFDEAAFFREGLLETAIDDALLIRMMDLEGELWVMSTPGYVCAGYHYDIVTGVRKGYEFFHWTYFDNPFMPATQQHLSDAERRAWREQYAADIREKRGWTEQTPSYVREFRGLYEQDLDALVYAFRPEVHYIDRMPDSWTSARDRWHTVLGIDFGSTHATSWVAWAFEKHSPVAYCIRARKVYGMAPSATADVTKEWIEELRPDVVIGDSAAKGYIDEHRVRHRIAIQGADKQGKRSHQMLFNDALRAVPEPRIRLLRGETADYASEMTRLGKDPRYGPRHERYGEEDPDGENDACDAGLYGWWKCWAWLEEYRKAADEAAERDRLSRLDPLGNTALQGIYGKPPPVPNEGLRGAFGLPALRRRMPRRR